jgi:TrmH family RNA methyltransferase
LQSKRFKCRELFGTQQWLHSNEASIRKNFAGPLEVIADHELEKISVLTTPNQVLAIFEKAIPNPVMPSGKITLLLDNIQDPGNMGSIIRIADWFGISNIVCTEHTADMYNPKVVQSTMGSLGRVNVFYTELEQWIQQHRDVKLYATALNGKSIKEVQLKEGLLLIGNEGKGISEDLIKLADEKITIPKIGSAESLNAAVATGIVLSHVISK